jgi:uncharacterized protein YjbI with pentapeptide repeats
MTSADLTSAYLIDTHLSGAFLSGAHLSRALLNIADLTGAYLYGADLRGADLRQADLTDTRLNGAKYSANTIFPAYFDPKAAKMVLTADPHKASCHPVASKVCHNTRSRLRRPGSTSCVYRLSGKFEFCRITEHHGKRFEVFT